MNKGKKNIFLIGFMGAGKSTIARAIKQKLGYPVVEMDDRKRTGNADQQNF